ncbi:Pleckstrin homology domain-containing protein [Hypoxylon argillaceum]|nr:Pleckstrin homology domain-containing protein [Hypoxylon argillaceum]KAI1152696.1 Pleckstrin homology domain-containing protein [Nemania diffusa]
MADEQKPVALSETTPAVAELVAEPVVAETKPAEEVPVVEAPAEVAAEETAAVPAEEAKEEVKPIEAGTLEHKGAPANFPKNLLYAKNHFWFGADALEKEKLATYLKNEKASDVAHHVVSWAAETGKGLLFYGKESDKSTATGVIQLSEASEPTVDGSNKFHFTAKGHKHAFKAPTAADRDNWVEQLKLKIAEAKELATTVTESEAYKQTLEALKPAPPAKKEEKPAVVEAPKEEAPAEAAEPAEEVKEEDKKEEPKEEKKEEPKRRSASRKRASIFGNFLGKKDEAKKETPAEDKPAETEAAAATETTPIEQIIEATEAEAETAPAEAAPEVAAVEEPKEVAKPTPSKRASIFGGLSFGKKKVDVESVPTTPAKEETPVLAEAPVAETAPVIPAVETTEPLSAEVAAAAPAETAEAAPATNGEAKKEVKSDKRKSSLPFTFGKKEKASSDEEGEKKSTPFFSKLRQTVKKSKPAEKAAEEPTEDKPAEAATEPVAEAAADAKTEETKVEEPAAAPAAEEAPVETPVAAVPAPVTAAA